MLDLWNPWEIYDRLIEQIDPSVKVTASGRFGKWAFIENSESGAGMAFHMPVESIARRLPTDPSGMSLREVAAYAKSWNFAEAALGMAAVNSWYALPSRAEAAGFVPCQVNNWQNLFDPWSVEVAGKRVAVIGHFPFAAAALSAASELFIFERNVLDGDLPDTAAEYVLPTCDYVFITGSAFVNKTMPRLLELSRGAQTIIVGPSAPAATLLAEYGMNSLTTFSTTDIASFQPALGGQLLGGMYEAGRRIEFHA